MAERDLAVSPSTSAYDVPMYRRDSRTKVKPLRASLQQNPFDDSISASTFVIPIPPSVMESNMSQTGDETLLLLPRRPPARPTPSWHIPELWRRSSSQSFIVILVATGIIAFSGSLMGVPRVRMSQDIICCGKIGEGCNESDCGGNEVQSEVSHINNGLTMSTAICGNLLFTLPSVSASGFRGTQILTFLCLEFAALILWMLLSQR